MSDPFAPLSEKEITRGLWYVKHREALRRTVLVLLLVSDVGSVSFSLAVLGLDIARIPSRRDLYEELARPPSVRASETVTALQVGSVSVLSSGQFADVVVPVENPNAEFLAMVSYHVRTSEGAVGGGKAVIPPQSRQHLLVSSLPRTAGSLGFELDTVRWKRVDAHRIGRYETWAKRVGEIQIERIRHEPPLGGEKVRVLFQVKNGTVFHLAQIPLVILLLRGETIVGANALELKNLPSGASRLVDTRWYEPVGAFTNTLIETPLDLLDPENRYIPEP